jgi:hypothetical protein
MGIAVTVKLSIAVELITMKSFAVFALLSVCLASAHAYSVCNYATINNIKSKLTTPLDFKSLVSLRYSSLPESFISLKQIYSVYASFLGTLGVFDQDAYLEYHIWF